MEKAVLEAMRWYLTKNIDLEIMILIGNIARHEVHLQHAPEETQEVKGLILELRERIETMEVLRSAMWEEADGC